MARLDDSGYGSPHMKCTEEKENTVHFYLKSKWNKGSNSLHHDELVGAKQETLATVILQKYPKVEVEKFIFRAKIRGQGGPLCVDPFLLRCGSIQPKTEVETEECDNIYDNANEKHQQISKGCSKPESEVVLFFVSNSTNDRWKKQAITHVHYKTLHCDMCVTGYRGQTVRHALVQDGRFANVHSFTVNTKMEGGQGPKVGLNEKVEDFKGETLQINAHRALVSTDGSYGTTTSQRSGALENDSAVSQTSAKKRRKIQKTVLAKKLWEENALFVFSKCIDELTVEEMMTEMRECLEARAWCSLLGPTERSGNRFEKSVTRLAEVQFANQDIVARPVSFSKKICPLYDSVGHIRCGTVVATCFLVSDDMIVTNDHVVKAITKARRSSIHSDHTDVCVYFDYEEPGGVRTAYEYKLLPLLSEGNIHCKELDYAFLRLKENATGRKPLGEYVTSFVPENGKLCIVGHPAGKEKQDEMCPILPLHDNRYALEIERRTGSTSQDNTCLYMYNRSVMKYDVGSMFQGSSGAPVFNMNCEIVALHMGGILLEGRNVLEFGTTFDAIITDLKSKNGSQFVKKHFPYCYHEEMEQF